MSVRSVKATGWAQSFPVSGGVKASRQWTRRHLDTLGWNEWAPDIADSVLLAVSELVTNAHIHARSSAQLVLVWDNRSLCVSVHDSSSELPAARSHDTERLDGRGMALVEALSDTWDAHRQTIGKTVTACFRGPIALRCDPPCAPTNTRAEPHN